MVDVTKFVTSIDTVFWNHITKESRFKDIILYKDIDRGSYLKRIGEELKQFNYHFQLPYYLYIPKSRGVVRKVKIYPLSDTSIYYYCVKELQDEIIPVLKSVKNVYGGFRMTADLRIDDGLLREEYYDETYSNALNEKGFRKEWSDYQKLAKTLYDKEFKYYIHLDVTHFYDDINLDILERQLRSTIKEKQNIIDILFYFLRNSDKRDLGYSPSNVGIPQEQIGEMSRLLSSYYLHNFDKSIFSYLGKYFYKRNFVYTRYSDDIWICFNGEKKQAEKIIQVVSFYLQKIKLHLNEQKICIFNRREYYNYWYFGTWEKIHKNNEPKHALKLFRKLTSDKERKKNGRWYSPASYTFRVIISKKENVKLIREYNQAKYFIDQILFNPKLTSKVTSDLYKFFEELGHKFPQTINYLRKYLFSPKNIYPHTEYFILELLSKLYHKKDYISFFYSFLQHSHGLEYQWYSRVICYKYFIDNILILSTEHQRKKIEIIKIIAKLINEVNRIERRYNIMLLYHLNMPYSKSILNSLFNNEEDVSFIQYLKANIKRSS